MSDYNVVWKSERFTDARTAFTFIEQKKIEADNFINANSGLGYNDQVVRLHEEPKSDGKILYIVEYVTFEKIPFSLSISRKVDGDALKDLPKVQRNILTSKVASDDWDFRKKKWRLPNFLRKGKLKGGGQDVDD